MLVVHALWSPGRGVLLWAEDGERPATTSARSLRTARPHPFAVPSGELAALHPGKAASLVLLLPGRPSGPLASPELVRTGPMRRPRAAPELLPWTVPALAVDAAELRDPVPEVRYGASVAHLRAVLDLADDLAGRGRVLPTLAAGEGGVAYARWRPVVQGLDAVAFESLVAGVPPVGRAERRPRSGPGAPPDVRGHDPHTLLTDALAVLTDAAVRDRLARADEPVAVLPPRRGRAPAVAPVAESWLTALVSPDGRIGGAAGVRRPELDELARAVAAWDEVGADAAGPARASFRLAEVPVLDDPADPENQLAPSTDQTGDGTRWELQFSLRSTDDPSLLVPAARIWDGAGTTLTRLIGEPQELLLAELGRAALVYPRLTRALRSACPEVLPLDVEGAAEFLTEVAGRLLAEGFDVELPAGWDGSRRLGLRLSASSTAAPGVVVRGGLGREELAAFRWQLAVGDEILDEDEIAELVATKAPLVRLRGQWVTVDPDQLRAGLEFMRRNAGRRRSAGEVVAMAAAPPADAPLPVTGVEATGWLGDLIDGSAEHTLSPVEPPSWFTATLRPYQQRGLSWLAFLSALGLGACLADDMGLGKTVQLLALESYERDADRHAPTLLVCPMSLVGTWEREAARFAPRLRVLVHHGGDRGAGEEFDAAAAAADVVVTTYGTLVRDVELLERRGWHRVVLDEAQMVKNSLAASARAVRRLAAGHRVALTGTPIENRLAELWSVMDFLNPGMLGSAERFRQRFAIPVERYGDDEAAALLRRLVAPYLLRRVKTDPGVIDDLPEKIEITQHYRLTREQASLYRTVVDDMLDRIEGTDGIARRGNVLAAMAKLKQVCNHPAQLLHDGSPIGRRSGKVTRLEEILESILAEGDKVLCFTQYAEFASMLVPHLSGRFDQEVLYLHGGTPKKRRDEMVERFQSPDGPAIFLLSLKAGGTGLTLTAASHVVHLDRWWNPAVENQATDRAFRIGQRRNVQVRTLVCPGTVEERIDDLITSKKALSGKVIGDGENWVGELADLSTDRLREVFALSGDALADPADDPDGQGVPRGA
ncbi:DEAD/DEAH box helicase [Pseudonocardia benzenivorans]|uniref:SNF2-related protein n=1 Tax=Pseudonocardia benzenivorans TaxID=228005 RepID=UPI0031F7E3BA